MAKKSLSTRSVSPETAALWSSLVGGTVTTIEHEELRDGVLFPQLAPVIYDDEITTSLYVPLYLLPPACPDCGGPADLSDPDPLALLHQDERCEVAAEEEALERKDRRRLARIVAAGGDRKHRLAAPVERRLIQERGLTLPMGAFTTVLALPGGGRTRRWAVLPHEPALQQRQPVGAH